MGLISASRTGAARQVKPQAAGRSAVIRFNRDFRFVYETPQEVRPGVLRVVARNPKDYTWVGTNSFIVGRERVAVIDPGPLDRAHVDALLTAIAGRPVIGVFLTHSHLDHAPAGRVVGRLTGAPVFGFGPIDPLLAALSGEEVDTETAPEITLADGAVIEIDRGFRLEAVHTPGHFPNHLCYALTIHEDDGPPERILFSGDHVMGWSTTVIMPPLGSLADYLESLHKLLTRPETCYQPSHGPEISQARAYVRALIAHRHERERQIVACLGEGVTRSGEIVARIYEGLTPRLMRAAQGSVRAHLLYLEERGLIDETGRLLASPAEIDAAWPFALAERPMTANP